MSSEISQQSLCRSPPLPSILVFLSPECSIRGKSNKGSSFLISFLPYPSFLRSSPLFRQCYSCSFFVDFVSERRRFYLPRHEKDCKFESFEQKKPRGGNEILNRHRTTELAGVDFWPTRRFRGPSVKLKPNTISSRIETSTVVFESPDKKFCRACRCSPKLTDDFPQFSNMRIKDAVPEERRRRWSGKPFYSASLARRRSEEDASPTSDARRTSQTRTAQAAGEGGGGRGRRGRASHEVSPFAEAYDLPKHQQIGRRDRD